MFANTLDLNPRASPRALRGLLALHAGVIALVFLAQPPVWAALLVAALTMVSWSRLRRHAVFGFGPRALCRLIAHEDGSWTVEDARGRRSAAELLPGSCVHSALLVLNFRLDDGARRTRVLLGDELDAELLRRLRAHLLCRTTRSAVSARPR